MNLVVTKDCEVNVVRNGKTRQRSLKAGQLIICEDVQEENDTYICDVGWNRGDSKLSLPKSYAKPYGKAAPAPLEQTV